MDIRDTELQNDSDVPAGSSLTPLALEHGEQEYEAQYFNFLPKSLTDTLYNIMLQYFHDGMTATQAYLLKECKEVTDEATLQASADRLRADYVKVLNKAFDKLEHYVAMNMLKVPENVLLPEDHLQLNQYEKWEEDKIDCEITHLEESFMSLHYANATLREELKEINLVKEQCTEDMKVLQKLETVSKKASFSRLKDTLQFLGEIATTLVSESEAISSSALQES